MMYPIRINYLKQLTVTRPSRLYYWNPVTRFTKHYTDRLFAFLRKWQFLREDMVTVSSWDDDVDTIHLDAIEKLIHKQWRYLREQNLHPARVIIGRDAYETLRIKCSQYTQFSTPLFDEKYRGIPIHLTPYINGVIVLPEEK